VISIGPRVIFNNPTSVLGVVVFTDGSSPPKVFDKGTLATVDPAAPGGVASRGPTDQGETEEPDSGASSRRSAVVVREHPAETAPAGHHHAVGALDPHGHAVVVIPALEQSRLRAHVVSVSASTVGGARTLRKPSTKSKANSPSSIRDSIQIHLPVHRHRFDRPAANFVVTRGSNDDTPRTRQTDQRERDRHRRHRVDGQLDVVFGCGM